MKYNRYLHKVFVDITQSNYDHNALLATSKLVLCRWHPDKQNLVITNKPTLHELAKFFKKII